jgi:flagellar motility protein MotE (MotC chaperone)
VEEEDVMDDGSAAEITETDPERMERIKQLAKVYEQMNASSVAAIVTNMREDDAVDILSNMKPRNAAKVLASLDPEKAAKLSLRLTE